MRWPVKRVLVIVSVLVLLFVVGLFVTHHRHETTPMVATSAAPLAAASAAPTDLAGGVPTAFSHPGANVIVIAIDTLRADSTTMCGYRRDTTPNLERFAQHSYLFRKAWSVAPWTVPSFMSIFTGLFPSHHGVTNKFTAVGPNKLVATTLSPTILTLPQILHRHGYVLAGFTGDAGVSGSFGFSRGFSVYRDDLHFGAMNHSIPLALAWLKHRPTGKPFFLFVHGYDVHGMFTPPHGYTRRFVHDYHGKLTGSPAEDAKFREASLYAGLQPGWLGHPHVVGMTAADGRFYKALYDEKIYDCDKRIHRFLVKLKKMGLYDNSIIVMVSDHGDEFLDHGSIDHGQSLYDELVHVLLMIHLPGQVQGQAFDDPVNSFDALPTVLDCLGIPIHHHIDAVSLRPLMTGGKMPQKYWFSETDYRFFVHKRSVRDKRYKLILDMTTMQRELYDTIADPHEKHNLINEKPKVAMRLEKVLEAWLHSLGTPLDEYRGVHQKPITVF